MASTTNDVVVLIHEAYWSAGDRFGWNDFCSRTGVGIAVPFLRGDGTLTIKLDKPEGIYVIDKEKARTWVKRFKAFDMRRGKRLAVVPLDCFDKLPEDKPSNDEQDSTKEIPATKRLPGLEEG